MPSTFHGISTMSSALRAYQLQLDTTGNNIANVDTTNYSRQRVETSQSPGIDTTAGATIRIGSGVSVDGIIRLRDMFQESRRLDSGSKLSGSTEASEGLQAIEASFMEPGDSGISAALDAFHNAWSSLSASPDNSAAKADVQTTGKTLASRISGLATDLQGQRGDTVAKINQTFDDIDAKTKTIADLNKQIAKVVATGSAPNDLFDQRDTAIRDLASMVNIQSTINGQGQATISVGGKTLVDPSGASQIPRTYDATTGTLTENGLSFPVTGGTLGGAFSTLGAIDDTTAKLNTFADTLRTEVNALVKTGTNAAGVTGLSFFADPVPPATSITASEFRLDDTIAGDANSIPSGTSGLSGDGILAAQLSSLRDTKIAALGNQSIGNFYAGLVSDVGRKVSTAQTDVDTNQAVVTQIDAQIASVSGVSLDDEMANMLRFQRSYQAAAKALSTFDQMTQTLIDMLQR